MRDGCVLAATGTSASRRASVVNLARPGTVACRFAEEESFIAVPGITAAVGESASSRRTDQLTNTDSTTAANPQTATRYRSSARRAGRTRRASQTPPLISIACHNECPNTRTKCSLSAINESVTIGSIRSSFEFKGRKHS